MNKKEILDLEASEAREYFLQGNVYSNLKLPNYIQFNGLLKTTNQIFNIDTTVENFVKNNHKKIRKLKKINYIFFTYKDSYSLRPLSLINPVLYVDLVRFLTKEENWVLIQKRFEKFRKNSSILAFSFPFISKSFGWDIFNKDLIEKSLYFDFLYEIDISDFYSSIYTHTIERAFDGREEGFINVSPSKNDGRKRSLGQYIDFSLQNMNLGQTVGIPQGSFLMDFLAEGLLGYIDLLISQKIQDLNISSNDYYISRYRDDYRVFFKEPFIGEKIKGIIFEVLLENKLKLNSSKTKLQNDIILSYREEGFFHKLKKGSYPKGNLSYFLLVKDHSISFPNSNSLYEYLNEFQRNEERKFYFLIKDFLNELKIFFKNPSFKDVEDKINNILKEKDFYKAFNSLDNFLSSYCIKYNDSEEDKIKKLKEIQSNFKNKLLKLEKSLLQDTDLILAIIADIACRNLKRFSNCMKIISHYFYLLENSSFKKEENKKIQKSFFQAFKNKLSKFTYRDYLDIWVQRLIIKLDFIFSFNDNHPICYLVDSFLKNKSTNLEDINFWDLANFPEKERFESVLKSSILDTEKIKSSFTLILEEENDTYYT